MQKTAKKLGIIIFALVLIGSIIGSIISIILCSIHKDEAANNPSLVVLSYDNRVYYGGDFSIKVAYKYADGSIEYPSPNTIIYESVESIINIDSNGKIQVVEDIYNGETEYKEHSVIISISSSNKNIGSIQISIKVVPVNTYSITKYYYDENTLELKSEFIPAWQEQPVDELVDPILPNYYFENWYVESIGDNVLLTPIQFHAEDKYLWGDNICIKPKFYADLQFDVDEMPISVEKPVPVKVYFDEPISNTLPAIDSSLAGWSFDGWFTEIGGKGDENGIQNGVFRAAEPILYAKWSGIATLNLTQIIHNDDNKDIISRVGTVGAFPTSASTEVHVIYHGAINLESSQIPTYSDGGTFGGWYTGLYGTGKQITNENGEGIYCSTDLELYDRIIFVIDIDYNYATGNYDSNNNSFNITYGEIVDLVSNGLGRNPTKTGWNFSYWEVEYENSRFEIPNDRQYTLLRNITITAVWTWTFYLNASIEDYSLSQKTFTITFQDEFSSLPSLENWGSWSFDGWYSRGAGEGEHITVSNYDTVASSSSSNITTLYAKWIIKTVTLNDNNADTDDTYIHNLIYGKSIRNQVTGGLPTPASRAGYSIGETSGWYTDNNTYSIYIDDASLIKYPKSMSTLFFKWIPESYTVYLNHSGGESTVSQITVTMGEPLQTVPVPTYAGKTFSGYYTKSSDHMYYQPNGQGNGVWETPNATGMTLYAQWDVQVYTVIFDGNNGECTLDSIKVSYNKDMIKPNGLIPARTGFTFVGFYDNQAGTGDPYYDKSLKNMKKWDKTSDGTLYAKWEANELVLTVKKGDSVLNEYEQYSVGDDYIKLSIAVSNGTGNYSYNITQSSNHLTMQYITSSNPQIKKAENDASGTVTITVVDNISKATEDLTFNYKTTGGGGGSCVAAGTLVTLANGQTKKIENVSVGDTILTFDHSTGSFMYSKVLYNVLYGSNEVAVVTMYFSNDITVQFVNTGHGIYDVTLNQYVLINADNVRDYLWHKFLSSALVNGEYSTEVVEMYKCEISYEAIDRYDIVTENTINCVLNNLITCSDALVGVCNTFAFSSDFTYDMEQMAQDIATYGLYTYEEWSMYLTYEDFVAVNGACFKIAVSKGLITEEEIFELLEFLYESRIN